MARSTQWTCHEVTTFVWNGWEKSGWANAKDSSLSVHRQVDALGMWNGWEKSGWANAQKWSLRVHGKIDAMGRLRTDNIFVEWVEEKWVGQCQKLYCETLWARCHNRHVEWVGDK